MDEEELYAGPEGVLLVEGGAGACCLLSQLEFVAQIGGAIVECVEADEVCGVHDKVRPVEKLVLANAC